MSYVLPLFVWLFPLFPLFTVSQQQDLNHFYFTCLRRVLHCLHWRDNFFAFVLNEKTLEDRCRLYWDKYFVAWSESIDGRLIFEQANFNVFREIWLRKEHSIKGLRRSKRFVHHSSLLTKCASWCASIASNMSTLNYDIEDVLVLSEFPESF